MVVQVNPGVQNCSMTIEEAQKIVTDLTAKVDNGETLSEEDWVTLTKVKRFLNSQKTDWISKVYPKGPAWTGD